MDKLLPCPFCGGEADYDEGISWIFCSQCGVGYEERNGAKIVNLWNRRSAPKSDAGMVEALRTALEFYAESVNWQGQGLPSGEWCQFGRMELDMGGRAREALASLPKQKNG